MKNVFLFVTMAIVIGIFFLPVTRVYPQQAGPIAVSSSCVDPENRAVSMATARATCDQNTTGTKIQAFRAGFIRPCIERRDKGLEGNIAQATGGSATSCQEAQLQCGGGGKGTSPEDVWICFGAGVLDCELYVCL